jgi:hypothetical protein
MEEKKKLLGKERSQTKGLELFLTLRAGTLPLPRRTCVEAEVVVDEEHSI